MTDTSAAPVSGARVTLKGLSVDVTTPESGRFRFNDVPAGLYVMTIGKLGYRSALATIRVAAGDTLRPAYELIPTGGTVLGEVKVTGTSSSPTRQDFDARRAFGRGKFMTEEEIDKRSSAQATELLRTFSTISIVSPLGSRSASAPVYYAASRREGGGTTCPMAVVVDGFQMPIPYDLSELPAPKEIMGIEVYAGNATIPVQFARWNTGCGLILVWRRDGSAPGRPPG